MAVVNKQSETSQASDWGVVFLAFGAGVIAATHIGKLPPALGVIQAELGAGLVLAGWIASMISAVGTFTGLVVGSVSDGLGPHRILVAGLVTLVLGSVLGAFAGSPETLFVARFIEGFGFTATTVSAGILIARATLGNDRSRALAIWASFMPLGFTAMLLVSAAVLEDIGWRLIWFLSAAPPALWALVLLVTKRTRAIGEPRREARNSIADSLATNLKQTGALLAAACYALYAAQHIGMMVWLPTMLLEIRETTILVGASFTAMVLLANASGNYLAAWQLGRSVAIWQLLMIRAVGMFCVELLVFREWIPDAARIVLLMIFGVAGGLIPASALAAAPVYAPSPALVGVLSGLMVMATNLGQLTGPPLLAASRVAADDWSGTVIVLSSLALMAIACAAFSSRYEMIARIGERAGQ